MEHFYMLDIKIAECQWVIMYVSDPYTIERRFRKEIIAFLNNFGND